MAERAFFPPPFLRQVSVRLPPWRWLCLRVSANAHARCVEQPCDNPGFVCFGADMPAHVPIQEPAGNVSYGLKKGHKITKYQQKSSAPQTTKGVRDNAERQCRHKRRGGRGGGGGLFFFWDFLWGGFLFVYPYEGRRCGSLSGAGLGRSYSTWASGSSLCAMLSVRWPALRPTSDAAWSCFALARISVR